jgi:hypothetical protein
MGITLNKNSWHFKYYSSMISETPPRSLCPYFWTMVLLIIISPIIGLAFLISLIGKKINSAVDYVKFLFRSKEPEIKKPQKSIEELIAEMDKKYAAELVRTQRWNKAGDVVSKIVRWVVSPLMAIFVLVSLGGAIYDAGWLSTLSAIGIIILVVGFILGLIYVIEEYGSRMGYKISKFFSFINPLNWKVVIIIGEMIKTAYTKACPLITWEGNDVKESKTESYNA